jgi:hypothetical protein
MEITEEYVTMLTPDGEFLRTRHEQRPYELGEEILFFPLRHDQREPSEIKRKRSLWRGAVISSVAAAVFLLFFIPYYLQQQVYAYMSIDINPSLELGVNRQLEVVEVKTFNEEAEKLMTEIEEWAGFPIHKVAVNILSASEKQGYLKTEKEVLITTVFTTGKKDYTHQLLTDLQTVTENWEKKTYTIQTVKSSLEEREKAQKAGISTGAWLRKEEKVKSSPLKLPKEEEVQVKEQKEPADLLPSQEKQPSAAVVQNKKETINETPKPAKQPSPSIPQSSKQETEKKGEKELKPESSLPPVVKEKEPLPIKEPPKVKVPAKEKDDAEDDDDENDDEDKEDKDKKDKDKKDKDKKGEDEERKKKDRDDDDEDRDDDEDDDDEERLNVREKINIEIKIQDHQINVKVD